MPPPNAESTAARLAILKANQDAAAKAKAAADEAANNAFNDALSSRHNDGGGKYIKRKTTNTRKGRKHSRRYRKSRRQMRSRRQIKSRRYRKSRE